MNDYIPSKSNQKTEDTVDIVLYDYFKYNGWNIAFYSSPCGSWSTINLIINDELYQTFSPRDLKRPDIIFYKIKDKNIDFLIIESKDILTKFNPHKISQYTANMNEYINKIINGKFRFKKCQNGILVENIKLQNYTYNLTIGFACNATNWVQDAQKLNNLILKNQIGALINTNWIENIVTIKIISKNKNTEDVEKKLFR